MSNLSKDEVEVIVRETVRETLFSLGLNSKDEAAVEEVRKDLAHLRKWRNSVEQVQSTTWAVAVATVIAGLLGALWLGMKVMIGQ